MGLAGTLGVSALLGGGALACAPARQSYDVVVVGAGVVGCCCARELARYDLSVLVVEAGLDIASGATRANSGIVHVGFDPTPGTLKARYNVLGADAYPRWQEELGFTYVRNGALVLAFNDEERSVLDTLAKQAEENGTEAVEIIGAEQLRALEPEAPAGAVAALHAPTSAIVDPYGVALAAAENAVDNGVEFLFGRAVMKAKRTCGGFDIAFAAPQAKLAGTVEAVQPAGGAIRGPRNVSCRCVLNAAGVHADEINNMLSTHKLRIQPKRGEYLLYRAHSPFTRTMFQAPTAAGKGVLVGSTVFGNAFIGPNSVAQASKEDASTTADGMANVLDAARKTWGGAGEQGVISTFAGLRAANADGGDFVIGQAKDAPGLFNAACIDSPGLASAPAIAEELAREVGSYLKAAYRSDFNPRRQAEPLFAFADEQTKAQLLAKDPAYGVVVCACYDVTQAEVVAALRGKLPVCSLDAIKWRTGATMGQCQGSRCLARIAQLAADELGIAAHDIEKRRAGSALGVGEVAPEVAAGISVEFDEGVYELPRASYLIPGARPVGVWSARDVLELMAHDRMLPGNNVVIWGNTSYAQHATDALRAAGATVTRIDDDARIAQIVGHARIEGVLVERNGAKQIIACDALVISHDLTHVE